MTLKEIIAVLENSVDYIEFMINYDELIPEIIKAKNNSSSEDCRLYNETRTKIKTDLREKYKNEVGGDYILKLFELKYLHNEDVSQFANELERLSKRYIKFKKLFK